MSIYMVKLTLRLTWRLDSKGQHVVRCVDLLNFDNTQNRGSQQTIQAFRYDIKIFAITPFEIQLPQAD